MNSVYFASAGNWGSELSTRADGARVVLQSSRRGSWSLLLVRAGAAPRTLLVLPIGTGSRFEAGCSIQVWPRAVANDEGGTRPGLGLRRQLAMWLGKQMHNKVRFGFAFRRNRE